MGRPGGGGARAAMRWLSGGGRDSRARPGGGRLSPRSPPGRRRSSRPSRGPRDPGTLRAATRMGPGERRAAAAHRQGGGARLRRPRLLHRPQHAPDVVDRPPRPVWRPGSP
uniref:Uncharacterized protein n=1 Tax=Tursiops truncatus TaxID=9739 RepID=A0A6J3QVL8_TURTR|nr:putative uncharacterized protein FLJ45840 [Tursiops truncatus]